MTPTSNRSEFRCGVSGERIPGVPEQLEITENPCPLSQGAHVPGVEGIDTRALTKHIRQAGAMRAALSTLDLDPDSLVSKARQSLL